MNLNNESFVQLYEGSGFGNFLKDQSKNFIKKAGTKAIEKAVNTGGEKVGELIANKIISSPSSSKLSKDKKNENLYNTPDEIPIDSGYKIIKLLQKNQPVDIRKQFNSI